MEKPSWNFAPNWANYLAQDDDGSWYWFEYLPKKSKETREWIKTLGKYEEATKDQILKVDWDDTLEDRTIGNLLLKTGECEHET